MSTSELLARAESLPIAGDVVRKAHLHVPTTQRLPEMTLAPLPTEVVLEALVALEEQLAAARQAIAEVARAAASAKTLASGRIGQPQRV